MKKWLAAIIIVLVVAIGVTAYLNADSIAEKKELQKNSILIIKMGEDEVKFNMNDIKALGEEEFKANLKTNGKAPIEYNYKGVDLKKIIDKSGFDVSGKDTLITQSVDGYTIALGLDEAMKANNVYAVYEREGELLGTKEDGGKGPYMTIIREDKFSQRRCKYLTVVEIQ